MELLRTIFAWLLIASVFTAKATTFYIDPSTGSDANVGTQASPFKTFPGTEKVDGSGYLNTAWGSFTSSAKVPDNTAFIMKSGTTMNSNVCGLVFLGANSSDFYINGCTNLYFGTTNNWGSGPATLDASNVVVGIAEFLIDVDGVTVNGLTIQNSSHDGLQVKEKQGSGVAETNISLLNLTFFNNGTSGHDDSSGSGLGQIQVRYATGLLISNCTANGNHNWSEGFLLGDAHKHVINALVQSCIVSNVQGDIPNNDSGIGFKALNSVCTWSNDVSVGNLKGWDLGEESGDGGVITYKVISCTASNNYWGINYNSVADIPYSGLPITFYGINNLVVSNALSGFHCYAGPYSLFLVNNVVDNNGGSAADPNNSINLSITPNDNTDTNLITAYVYNNIFQRPYSYQLETSWDSPTNNQNWNCDYNSYKQNGSESFCLWSLSYGPSQATFSYGANGPGHASGNWWSWFANSVSQTSTGTGHHNSDAHSKGTGSSDTSLPSFGPNYTLTSSYPGTSLAAKPWFIPEMGIDRTGKARIAWDMGPSESLGTNLVITISPNPASVSPLQVVTYGLSVLTNGVVDISYSGISYVYVFNGVNISSQQSANPTSGAASFTAAAGNVGFTNAVATLAFSSITLTSNIIPFRQVAFGTTLTLTSSANPTGPGNNVTFTAQALTNSLIALGATGPVDFYDGATPLGSVSISSGQAQISTSALTVGTHTIKAIYEGDANYTPATNTLSQAIVTGTALTINASTNIMVIGSGGNLGINGAVQTNGVTATDGTGTTTLIGSPFTMTVGTYSYNPPISAFGTTPGPFNFTVTYTGNYGSLTSATLTINLVQYGTTLTVGSSANPSIAGNSITITASGFTNSLPIIPATGLVHFMDLTTSTSLGSASMSSGQAQISTSALTVGTHVIRASYDGDTNYTSALNTFSQAVNAPSGAFFYSRYLRNP